jgi:hypothetical protein
MLFFFDDSSSSYLSVSSLEKLFDIGNSTIHVGIDRGSHCLDYISFFFVHDDAYILF